MAGLSRAKAASIQILRTAELKASECKRPAITQFHARTARSQVAAQVAAPRPCASPVRLGWGRRLEPAHWALPPPPLLRGQQGASRDRLTSLGLRHVAQDPCPYPAPYHPADEKDQVPAPPPHHQDAEGLQEHLQGLVREDLLRLDGCTSTLIVVPPLVVSIIKHESVSSICKPSRGARVRRERDAIEPRVPGPRPTSATADAGAR